MQFYVCRLNPLWSVSPQFYVATSIGISKFKDISQKPHPSELFKKSEKNYIAVREL